MTPPNIRAAETRDVPDVIALIRALAEFEKLPGPDDDGATRFAQHFAEHKFSLLVAEHDGRLVGYALSFFTYSTFVTRPSLYLEDLFVLPEARGHGIGLRFMQALAKIADDKGCGRFEWCVLDWNVGAQKFYRSLGAELLETWRVCRMEPPAIAALARSATR